jgi:hypothetical protein
MSFGDILILSLAVASASMTIATSNALEWLRSLVSKLGGWSEELIHCPYCLSHWLAAIVAVMCLRGTVGELIVSGLAMITLASLASLGITHFFLALDALDRSEE